MTNFNKSNFYHIESYAPVNFGRFLRFPLRFQFFSVNCGYIIYKYFFFFFY